MTEPVKDDDTAPRPPVKTPRKRAKKAPAPVVVEKPHWFEHRSTGDLLVMLIAATVCFCVLASGATVALLAFIRPEVDTSTAVGTISDVINTLIGLLAGFLAGRTDAHMTIEKDRIEVEKASLRAERNHSATAADV